MNLTQLQRKFPTQWFSLDPLSSCHVTRLFESFGAPPAKWTVMVYGLPSSVFKVYVIKMDRQVRWSYTPLFGRIIRIPHTHLIYTYNHLYRQVLEQRQFPSSQTMELVEFVKGHAFINSLWSFCRGIR